MAWVSEKHISETTVKIKDFEWLCGKWEANASKGPVTMQARLIDNGHFIECTTSGVDGKNTSRQIIGYNPRLGTLISFHFDSSGGMGRGLFQKENGVWRQLCTGTLPMVPNALR